MAVANYNDDSSNQSEFLKNSEPYLKKIPDNITNITKLNSRDSHYTVGDLQNKIWFTKRKFNLENSSYINQKEDAFCDKIYDLANKTVCSYSQLNNITYRIDDLTQKGFVSNFYNTDKRVYAIEKPVETYISYLNHFIIVSLITGPITSIMVARYYVKWRGKKSNE